MPEAEIRVNFSVDPLQEVDRPLRKRLTEEYGLSLDAIAVKESVTPGTGRWTDKRVEEALRGSFRIPLKILATTAYEQDKEVQAAGNGQDQMKARKALLKKLAQSHRNLDKAMKDAILDVLKEIEGTGNPEAQKALKDSMRELEPGLGADIVAAIGALEASFVSEISALLKKIDRIEAAAEKRAAKLAGRRTDEDDRTDKKTAEDDDDSPKDTQITKARAATAATLKGANEAFDRICQDGIKALDTDIATLRAGARKKDIGEETETGLTTAAGELQGALATLQKAYRDTKPDRDRAVRAIVLNALEAIGKATDGLPDRGGPLGKACVALDKVLEQQSRKLKLLLKAVK